MKTATALMVMLSFCHPTLAGSHALAYDETRVVIVKDATVTNFVWTNPHALLMFDANDDSGKVVHWAVKADALPALKLLGWTPTAVQPGDKITVYLWQLKNHTPSGRVQKIVLSDGSVFETGSLEFINADSKPLVAACLASSQPVCYAPVDQQALTACIASINRQIAAHNSHGPMPVCYAPVDDGQH